MDERDKLIDELENALKACYSIIMDGVHWNQCDPYKQQARVVARLVLDRVTDFKKEKGESIWKRLRLSFRKKRT